MTKKAKDNVSEAQTLANELLGLMGTSAKAKASEDKENQAVVIDIDTEEEKGLLIGRRGETLNSFQSVLGMLLKRKLDEWVRVVVNIGDWREKQDQYLKDLAYQTAEKVLETKKPEPLYNLTAAERRIVHMELANHPDVTTQSEGEDSERYLVVKPKGA